MQGPRTSIIYSLINLNCNMFRSMFEKDGTVVDVAIATLLCDGLSNPQSMGLGGGFLATLYIKSTGETISLVARESAPLAATEDMFVNKTVSGSYGLCKL